MSLCAIGQFIYYLALARNIGHKIRYPNEDEHAPLTGLENGLDRLDEKRSRKKFNMRGYQGKCAEIERALLSHISEPKQFMLKMTKTNLQSLMPLKRK